MSEFDREAEREKLRKQFERDRERRKSTERMSELLLKGATMTNKHCDVCGSPVFRQNGREFCPAEADGGHERAQAQAGEQAQQPAESTDQQAPDAPTEPEEAAPTPDVDAQADTEPAADHTHATHDHAEAAPSPPAERTGLPARSDDLGDARASLARTLTRLATRAEGEDDLGRAREYLEAAKEAAEALEATRRADR